uniref:Envelope glycoprotein n=2 Tax=Engystomops pustulosus TaxID=76066 RepID=A0AAV6YNW5_ENGPU|nr:hypothetical protein GDO81_021956 [Engystomops pustulosus]
METPFVGCMKNVSVLVWNNETFLLIHYHIISKDIKWTPLTLEVQSWDLNLTKLKQLIQHSEFGQQLIQQLNKSVQYHTVTTTIVADKIVKMGSSIQEATSHHWWDIFMGYSPSAERMLNWLIHPVIVIAIIVITLSIWNCYMTYKLFTRPRVVMVN